MKENDARAMQEIERKYEAVDGLEPLDPAGLLGFGTADLRLLAAGVTLRRREGGSDTGWHLQAAGG